jgi:beta-barrel assembly-enhancing protease
MQRLRLFAFIILIISGCMFIGILYVYQIKTTFTSTLAPLYQTLGISTKNINRALTKIIPVDSLDEKKFGEAIKIKHASRIAMQDRDYTYCNQLIKKLEKAKKKPFSYTVFIYDSPLANAWALPGGVIFVTRGLLKVLSSEAELVAVLSHEMGHIERSHCLDTIRFELLTKKIGQQSQGRLADMAFSLMLRHSFNKTQENEADTYAYALLLTTHYDPAALGRSFLRLKKSATNKKRQQQADPINEYFMTHPYLALRAKKFSEKAQVWWKLHPEARRYKGTHNLREREVFSPRATYIKEWVTGYTP